MGTNFYYSYNRCECCGREDRLHIGKSSAGWTFSFQAHQEPSIRSYTDWLDFFMRRDGIILDEYGRNYTVEGFREVVENRPNGLLNAAVEYPAHGSYLDPDGHSFDEQEFS